MNDVAIPKDTHSAEDAIKFILRDGKMKRNPKAIRWWISRWYMRGVRNFKNINYQAGSVQLSYINDRGVLQFLYEDILAKYQSQLGRLMGLNLYPAVTKEGISLDGMRKASVAQVVLNSVFSRPKIASLQLEFFKTLLLYGTVGLIPWALDVDSMGIDVVPPWEIIPIPIEVDSSEKAQGILRRKTVPLQWLKDLPNTPGERHSIWGQMETVEVPIGMIPSSANDTGEGGVTLGMGGSSTYTLLDETPPNQKKRGKEGKDKRRIKAVEVAEIWTGTKDKYWDEYILSAGGKIIPGGRDSHRDERRPFPVQIVSDVDVGDFWGRAYVDTLIPLNCELEASVARQFQNVKEWDLYGIMYEPTTSGVPTNITRGRDGLKRARYEPDPVTPEAKPYNINPKTSGKLPVEVIQMGSALQDRIANQPSELMKGDAPGRVDSSAGLGTLFETSNIPMTPTAKACARAFSNCYRVVLDICKRNWGDGQVLDITQLDDTLAGIKLESGGQIALDQNAIPHPDEVVVSVESAIPRSKEQRKLEVKDALESGIITPTEYGILVRKESLELPVGNDVEWHNYRRAMLENLQLFNDGQQPGKIIFSERDFHKVHLMVLDSFMARPEFYLASPEVRQAFVGHREEHMDGIGMLPEGIPAPEDAAGEAVGEIEGMQQLMEQQAGQATGAPAGY